MEIAEEEQPGAQERLHNEISLLQAMYPDQISYDQHPRELRYRSPDGGSSGFTLRLPDDYLSNGLPTVLSAGMHKHDLRNALKEHLDELPVGEEVLDAVILGFEEVVAGLELEDSGMKVRRGHGAGERVVGDEEGGERGKGEEGKATVLVWLHHLLNTNKRKQALSPGPNVSGVTKPGYPGVLLYSGPEVAVRDHIIELRGLHWAAFQVRMESEEEWTFKHGTGVKEVEGLGDVVAEVGEDRKEEFMEAMRMK